MQKLDIFRMLVRLENQSLTAPELLNGDHQMGQLIKLINDGFVRREGGKYCLLDKGRSFLENNEIPLLREELKKITTDTHWSDVVKMYPYFSIKSIVKETKKMSLFNFTKKKKEESAPAVVPEPTPQPESTVSIVDDILSIIEQYGEPVTKETLRVLSQYEDQQILGTLSYLAKLDKIKRIGVGTYAPLKWQGESPLTSTITEKVFSAIKGHITLEELEDKLPEYSYSQIRGAVAHLKASDRIINIKKGVYDLPGNVSVSLSEMLDKEVVLSDLLKPPSFVNVKLGDKTKAAKFGGDFMMGFHFSPDLCKELGWDGNEKIDMRWSPLSQSLTLFPSTKGFALCDGDGSKALGFPIPKAANLPMPKTEPLGVPFEIKDNTLVLDVSKIG